ncbi:Cof-type HAD-IIB family hydrolase [Anaerorhabdus sp.]|uniref:Cof-type HAD-IIB family hydrolase n=1 Tax=Anaerorhabdus sp. TaxID=1872524 RepID=UPI002B1ED413|nr:Cof-type HAD-IIB family hydrolase [Anaerorhabdus sp.]MEA4873935.1 Cof-type HAD-IIB family hydrolase [Anaerorhabdus sp.]
MIKTIVSDLDGTFLTDDKQITSKNEALLEACNELGLHFIPASGRLFSSISEHILKQECVHYAICGNGSTIYDVKKNEEIYFCGIDKSLVLKLYQECQYIDATFDIFSDNHIYSEANMMNHLNDFGLDEYTYEYVKKSRTSIHEDFKIFILKLKKIDRLNMFYKSEKDRLILLEIIKKHPELSVSTSLKTNLEIMNVFASKGNALQWLCQNRDIDDKSTIAFGDANNDISLFQVARYKVAMSNACVELKIIADYVTCTNNESGVAHFFEENKQEYEIKKRT